MLEKRQELLKAIQDLRKKFATIQNSERKALSEEFIKTFSALTIRDIIHFSEVRNEVDDLCADVQTLPDFGISLFLESVKQLSEGNKGVAEYLAKTIKQKINGDFDVELALFGKGGFFETNFSNREDFLVAMHALPLSDKPKYLDLNFATLSNANITPDIEVLSNVIKGLKSIEILSLENLPEITEASVLSLIKAIEANPNIEILELRNIAIKNEGAKALVQVIGKSQIKGLSLDRCGITDEGIKSIAAVLNNSKIEEMIIGEENIGSEAIQALSAALKENKLIKTLYLTRKIDEQSIAILTEALKENKTLTSFALIDTTDLTMQHVNSIVDLIKTNNVINNLSIIRNKLGDDEAKVLAEALKTNTSITSLDLSGTTITSKGMITLCEVLANNKNITYLNFSGDREIGDEEALAIANLMKNNKNIKQLRLDKAKFTDQGLKYIAAALKVNTTLERMGLGLNFEKGSMIVGALLTNSERKKDINISGGLDHEKVSLLLGLDQYQQSLLSKHNEKKALSSHTSPETLDLSKTDITMDELECLSHAISYGNTNLTIHDEASYQDALTYGNSFKTINLSGNKEIGSSKGQEYIRHIIKHTLQIDHIILQDVGIKKGDMLLLAGELSKNNTVTKLDLTGNKLSEDTIHEFSEVISSLGNRTADIELIGISKEPIVIKPVYYRLARDIIKGDETKKTGFTSRIYAKNSEGVKTELTRLLADKLSHKTELYDTLSNNTDRQKFASNVLSAMSELDLKGSVSFRNLGKDKVGLYTVVDLILALCDCVATCSSQPFKDWQQNNVKLVVRDEKKFMDAIKGEAPAESKDKGRKNLDLLVDKVASISKGGPALGA